MKRVCVYCGSSEHVDPKHFKLATQLGKTIAARGWELVYGGGSCGLMREVANGALDTGGTVTGIIPTFMKEREWAHDGLTQLIETTTMAERKAKFIEFADAYVVLPGGIGTMEEFFETLSLKKLQQEKGPVVLINYEGYYNSFIEFMNSLERQGYVTEGDRYLWDVASTLEEALELLDD